MTLRVQPSCRPAALTLPPVHSRRLPFFLFFFIHLCRAAATATECLDLAWILSLNCIFLDPIPLCLRSLASPPPLRPPPPFHLPNTPFPFHPAHSFLIFLFFSHSLTAALLFGSFSLCIHPSFCIFVDTQPSLIGLPQQTCVRPQHTFVHTFCAPCDT